MGRSGVITFKGHPMTLAGTDLKIGQAAPHFTLHFFEGGLKTITNKDLLGKPALISIVPSLDTGVCAIQTRRFNQELGALADRIHAMTVSRDLPFAMNRFCGAEEIKNLKVGSDYQSGAFGDAFGLTIEQLKLLTRAVVVLDASGNVTYCEIVPEVTHEPNYGAALQAIQKLL